MASAAPASAKARLTGLLLIVVVAVIWVCASFIVQKLQLHPFLITYFCNVLFLVYLPISILQDSQCRGKAQRRGTNDEVEAAAAGELQPLRVEPDMGSQLAITNQFRSFASAMFPRMSTHTWTIVKAAGAVAPVWFLAQLCFNTSLHMTSVTSNTILSSPSSLFTYFMSVLVLQEKFTYNKLAGVMVTVVGVLLLSMIPPLD